ncbi:MAG TPA: helix-turn-helix transcriptional regulator [Ferruginibacter sp.]|nr:helix-turn-helix transcriptional regulator [Ferruginibacter sp.]HMP20786.1 helix-turn-helix transcriptional regulator [Ferruginibacter sp.]
MLNGKNVCVSGNSIRKLRQLNSKKQHEVAAKLGISQQAYSKIEAAKKVSVKRVSIILNALGSDFKALENVLQMSPPSEKE